MYRIKEIQKALFNVVGWEQSYDPRLLIDDDLVQSESGLTFQQTHPLMTINNMASVMPEDYALRYALWSNEKAYKKGDRCRVGNQVYQAMFDNTNENPKESQSWKEYTILNDYLRQITNAGITQAVQTFIQSKQIEQETRSLLEHRTFFDGAGRINATLNNTHKIVGFEIVPLRHFGVTTKIERVGLQMTGANGIVKLYLFHLSQVEPLRVFDLEYTKANGSFQWFNLDDCYLPYVSDEISSGGSYYLVYNQDDLPTGMQAINVSKDWSREPCGTCNIGSIEAYRELSKHLQISPFMQNAPTTFAEFPEMWDIANNIYTNTQNYGMNVEVSIGCDLTDFIIKQRDMFKSVIQKQVTCNALRALAMNADVRVNRNQSNASRMDILYELDGNTQGRATGLGYEMREAYKALRIDTKGIDRVCLSCNNHGVRYKST